MDTVSILALSVTCGDSSPKGRALGKTVSRNREGPLPRRFSSPGTKDSRISRIATGYRAPSTGVDSRMMPASPRLEMSILAAAKKAASTG